MTSPAQIDLDALRFDDGGLLPVVAQAEASGAVLMLAWANRDAVERTLATGEAHFFSRSRDELWHKGETSGNTMAVVAVTPDCDGDALLYRVRAAGPACHRDTRSCFEPNPAALELGWLEQVLAQRRVEGDPGSYTVRLLGEGTERIARKLGEEAAETVIAAVAPEPEGSRERLVSESADLFYHLLVLLCAREVTLSEVAAELAHRHALHPTPRATEP